MNDKVIRVVYRPAFGKERFYPEKSDSMANAILCAMGRKSFTRTKLAELKSAGFEIEVKENPPKI